MPTLAFNSLINQLDDNELALFIKEIARQNSLSMRRWQCDCTTGLPNDIQSNTRV